MVTSLYAALLSGLYIVLSVHVIRGRRCRNLPIGDAGDAEMIRRIRAHGNLSEYAPIFLILLMLAEFGGLSLYAVHLFGLLFLAGRISHAYGLTKPVHRNGDALTEDVRFRIAGMVCTFVSLGGLSLILLIQYGVG